MPESILGLGVVAFVILMANGLLHNYGRRGLLGICCRLRK